MIQSKERITQIKDILECNDGLFSMEGKLLIRVNKGYHHLVISL